MAFNPTSMTADSIFILAKRRLMGQMVTPLLDMKNESEWPEDVLIWMYQEAKLSREQREAIPLAMRESMILISDAIRFYSQFTNDRLDMIFSTMRLAGALKLPSFKDRVLALCKLAFDHRDGAIGPLLPPFVEAVAAYSSASDKSLLMNMAQAALSAQAAVEALIRIAPHSSDTEKMVALLREKSEAGEWNVDLPKVTKLFEEAKIHPKV